MRGQPAVLQLSVYGERILRCADLDKKEEPCQETRSIAKWVNWNESVLFEEGIEVDGK